MDTVHECDRQTDGRTDRTTITDTVQTASHGNDISMLSVIMKVIIKITKLKLKKAVSCRKIG